MTTTTTSTTEPAGPSELDLAFIIDATGSMGTYISAAQQNMKNIIHDIVISEKCLLNTALILYRDHPPQDSSFITRVYDFTDDVEKAKENIDQASASGGGDGPEAMTPALHDAVHKLIWRTNAVKIAILIADAPPHGLDKSGDHWPNGDPSGHDPMECVSLLAEHSITLYTIGCEPAATPYRDFLMALAFKTGGQYIPLANSANLASIIVGSAKEEITMEKLLAQIHEEVMQEAAARGGPVDETELTRRIHEVMKDGGVKARRVKMTNADGSDSIPAVTPAAEELSKLTTLKDVCQKWVRNNAPSFASCLPMGTLFATATPHKTVKVIKTRLPKKKATLTATVLPPVLKKKTPAKRAAMVKSKRPARKAPPPSRALGSRRSARLEFNRVTVAETDEDETMDVTPAIPAAPVPVLKTPTPVAVPTPIAAAAAKPSKLKTAISDVHLAEDELLDITQTRRLVRKCVARNKLESK